MTTSTGAQLKIMSYNIKYATESDGENSWSKRKDRVADLLKSHEPKVFGIQEARLKQLKYLEENLENYKYVGNGRDGRDKGLFNAIFYDSNTFEVEKEETFWLSETPDQPSKGWDAAYPRICTYALFKKKDTEEKFWVFNTHFDHQGEKAVEMSAELIIDTVDGLNDQNLPVVLMGDFNLEPGSKPIEFLSKRMADSREVAKSVASGPDGTFNAYVFDEPPIGRIDFIFVSRNTVDVVRYAVLNDSEDQKYPSDHFPVQVELVFK